MVELDSDDWEAEGKGQDPPACVWFQKVVC